MFPELPLKCHVHDSGINTIAAPAVEISTSIKAGACSPLGIHVFVKLLTF